MIKLLILLAIGTFTFISCDDDDDEHSHDEQEAVGLNLTVSDTIAVTQDADGNVSGHLMTHENSATTVYLKFIDKDGETFIPHLDDGFSAHYEVGDTNIAIVHDVSGGTSHNHGDTTSTSHWEFHVQGKAAGMTTLKVRILHEDHTNFTSEFINIHVHEASTSGGTPSKMILKNHSGAELATTNADSTTGMVMAELNTMTHIFVSFLDSDGNMTMPDTTNRFVEAEAADGSIATIMNAGNDSAPWEFMVNGVAEGMTTIKLKLVFLHEGLHRVEEIVGTPIQVHVHTP
ncbi:MAG: hypothetical protein DWQ06_16355 [Calditrichaeota bacterium]|nr:MAG: hypothetical protein DWQ06_16355 [Calditrichota bacterium]